MYNFYDVEHEEKFKEACDILKPAHDEHDKISCLYLLSYISISITEIIDHINSQYIEFRELLEGKYSSSEKAMIKIAANLYNSSSNPCDISELEKLDNINRPIALEAIQMKK